MKDLVTQGPVVAIFAGKELMITKMRGNKITYIDPFYSTEEQTLRMNDFVKRFGTIYFIYRVEEMRSR